MTTLHRARMYRVETVETTKKERNRIIMRKLERRALIRKDFCDMRNVRVVNYTAAHFLHKCIRTSSL